MRRWVTALIVTAVILAPPLSGQDPTPPPPESVPAAAPIPPSPGQERYLQGLRTAGRGVAQLKDGMSRLSRVQAGRDTTQVRQAARRLGGLCSAARGFLASGRGRMEPAAYEAPVRRPARDLVLQVDSLSLMAKECQLTAGKSPGPVAAGLLTRIRAYEAALATFRTAIGLPNRTATVPPNR
ncbi:MAG TPA: hypothetical protein VIV56_17005 [Gemmatimonadales bacterium]